jgi:site-specific DNA recombinase
MAVGIYLRVSTEEQRERQSIMTQREFGERYCALHKLTTHRTYSDDGVSGTIPLERRPEGSQILEDARLGRFDQLLIYRLDRLGRDTRLILNAVAELEKLGVRIRSMTEEFDTGTATGRLMLTMLSGFASHERDVIRERSLAGTNRVAEAGAWMGGIVPYGYRKAGDRAAARLVLSDEQIPGLDMSEVDVIRLIYRMAAVERQSCQKISDHLNRVGVPCSYARDDRVVMRGKRKQRTSGLWRPGRVRNLIVSTTYRGCHHYGKRSSSQARKLITRVVPAIVSEATWNKAQQTLRDNHLFSRRNARYQYLLRAKVKCGLCGLTYIGSRACRPSGKHEFYYVCNGKHGARGLYGEKGQRCPSKSVNGIYVENLIWEEVEGFLRNPGPVLGELHRRMTAQKKTSGNGHQEIEQLELTLKNKGDERARVLALYRRRRIDDATLDAQLKDIEVEEADLQRALDMRKSAAAQVSAGAAELASAEDLLAQLRTTLDGPVSWEVRRRLVEILVGDIRVNTLQTFGKKEAEILVTYRFACPVATCTGTRACNKRDRSTKRECRNYSLRK